MTRGRKRMPVDVELIVKLREEGKTQNQIAAVIGVSRFVIRRALEEHYDLQLLRRSKEAP